MTRTWPGRLFLLIVPPVGLVALWWWISANSDSSFFPPLSRVVDSLREDWLFEQFFSDLLPSLGRFSVGYALAGAVGIVAGTLIGLLPRLQQASRPVTEFVRSIPPPLMLPFTLVLIGTGNDAKVAVIVLGAVWPVLLNTIDGVRGVDPETLDMARSYGLSRWMRVSRVILPGASPKIMVGLRTALSVALILMIISEMVGATNGLGFQVLSAQRGFDSAGTYAGVIVIGVVGLVVNAGFLLVEARIMRWYRGARGLLEVGERRRRRLLRLPGRIAASDAIADTALPSADVQRVSLGGGPQ
jgi:ABC-type nitrate/sulfonate/bicarbonate transport system permease component